MRFAFNISADVVGLLGLHGLFCSLSICLMRALHSSSTGISLGLFQICPNVCSTFVFYWYVLGLFSES